MDNLRIGVKEPILLLSRAADKVVSLKPGATIRAQVAEVLPGGEVNLRIQGNLFRAKSLLQLPENASVLLRVVGQKPGEGAAEVRLQFVEVLSSAPDGAGQVLQKAVADPLALKTQELASRLALKTQNPAGLAATVENLLKALPDTPARIPAETRERLMTLLQTSLRTTGESIEERMTALLRQFGDRNWPPMRELAGIKAQVFADIETISQFSLQSTLANTGVGLEARLRALAEGTALMGERLPGQPPSVLGPEQVTGSDPFQAEVKEALVRLNQQGVPLPTEVKQALAQMDLSGPSLPVELKEALVRLNQQGVPLPTEVKQALVQMDLSGPSLPVELKEALVRLNQQGVPLPTEVKQALAQMDLSGPSLPVELKEALVRLNQQGVPLPAEVKQALVQLEPQTPPPPSPADSLQSDFKARLLQIREMVLDQQAQLLKLDLSERIANAGPLKEEKTVLDQMLKSIDGLLQDVETFQLLSKLTDSFYTFLPFVWKGLKEADLAFKRSGDGPGGRSYYCLVHLELEELGKLDIVAMMAGAEFYVTFKSDHDSFRSVLETHLNELQEQFAAKGLKLGLVSFYDMEEKQLAPFERLESFESLVSIRI